MDQLEKIVLITDRWKPYRVYGDLRQFCWAHLERDFKGCAEMKGEASRIGKQLLDRSKQMFNWWEKIRDGSLSRGEFRKRMQSIMVEEEDLLIDGEVLGVWLMAGKCAQITARLISRK